MHKTDTYMKQRLRMLKKLNERQKASDRPKFDVTDHLETPPCDSDTRDKLSKLVSDVIKLRSSSGICPYPECKFTSIDALWCTPPKETRWNADVLSTPPPVPWHRTRFFIEYKRAYGKFDVDFITSEPLPTDFSEKEPMLEQAGCTIDLTNRKIAMQYTLSDNSINGFARGNMKSGFLNAVAVGIVGWVKVDAFAANTDRFIEMANSCARQLHPSGDSVTQPFVVTHRNTDRINSAVATAAYAQLESLVTLTTGKPERAKDLGQQTDALFSISS